MAFLGCPGVESFRSLTTNQKGLLLDVVHDNYGHCYAHTFAEVLGAVYAHELSSRKKDWPATHIPLSAQQIIDQLPVVYQNENVLEQFKPEVGWVIEYMKNYGVTAKSEYDERAEIEENVNIQQMTRYRPMTITNIVNSPNLKKELRMYPLVGVMAAGETLYDYKCNDIYALKGPADHAVILTGYGVVGKQPVFEFKNSWGPDWGSKGYGLIHCDAILDIWKPSNIDVVMPDEET